ncbi:hypothetical protein BV97_05375 [Novosphingobium resinovorum]|jgi:hypothetical protein|uniref:Uncharacterized protein n=1 Tax=Novosphingobium resinovorum TaxID=158500 RepID=A0A031JBV8_9SPHN|nr:hypothetical protein [Novosphingobium resinovorum]EZP70666.1 hypothetical protein BV97_05375 [Novosphingobium resinovorum]
MTAQLLPGTRAYTLHQIWQDGVDDGFYGYPNANPYIDEDEKRSYDNGFEAGVFIAFNKRNKDDREA